MKEYNNFSKNLLVTIGPITNNNTAIKRISKSTDIFRLNGSHNTILWHQNVSNKIKKNNKKNLILLDIPGIKPRTLNQKSIKIKKNQRVCLYFDSKKININKFLCIKISNKLPKSKNKSKFFSINDGLNFFEIIKYNENYVIGKSKESFILKENKGINVPESIYNESNQLKKYNSFLNKCKKIKFDAIGLSFIQSKELLLKIKKKYPNKILVSKIENYQGVLNSEEIIKNSDAVMIDRGDLSAEIGNNKLFNSIIKISKLTKKHGVPLIMATENLENMILNNSPTKSEIISLEFNDLISVDKIMLSDETATSNNWKNILNWLDNYFKNFISPNNYKYFSDVYKKDKVEQSNQDNLWSSLDSSPNQSFLISTKSGAAIYKCKKFLNRPKIYIFTDNLRTYFLSRFFFNTRIFLVPKLSRRNVAKQILYFAKQYSKYLFEYNKVITSIFVLNPQKGSRANAIYMINKNNLNKKLSK